MKSHEAAEILAVLSRILKDSPEFDISPSTIFRRDKPSRSRARESPRRDDVPVALSALLSLSNIDKTEWRELIREIGLPIEIRPRDASRDILGKVLRILEGDIRARENLAKRAAQRQGEASPELIKALSALLGK